MDNIVIDINNDRFLLLIESLYSNKDVQCVNCRHLLYDVKNNNYLVFDFNKQIPLGNVRYEINNFMNNCSEKIYHYIIDFIYLHENSIIVVDNQNSEFKTKIFHKNMDIHTISIDNIYNYIDNLEIDWSKIQYPNAEIFKERICRVTL